MNSLNQQQRRQLIWHFYQENIQLGKAYTVKHFELMKISKRTTYNILKSASADRKEGSGGHNKLMTVLEENQLKRLVNGKSGVSQRKLAAKFNVSQTTIAKKIKKVGLKYRKKKKVPKVTKNQLILQKKRLSKLRRGIMKPSLNIDVILDDESYFTLTGAGMAGNTGYYTDGKKPVKQSVKFYGKRKFEQRVMVWCAISPQGVSSMAILTNISMNNIRYKEILRKNLLPFLKKKYFNGRKFVFWPDLATCHYHRDVLEFLEVNKIPYIKRSDNPPNCPEIRPIEKFWAHLKGKVYENNWEAQNIDQLVRRIKKAAKEFDLEYCQRLFKHHKTNVRKSADSGLESSC